MWTWLGSFMMNPLLAVGALSIAGPILIHLLSRRRHRRIRWAAMEFLLEALRRNRRRVKLEQFILLFLRCLAVLLVAMAMARPFVRPGALAALGGGGRSEHIILLDDSLSMSYRSAAGAGGGDDVFALARNAAKLIAEAAAEESEVGAMTLLTTSRPRTPRAAVASLSNENLRRFAAAVDGLAVTQGTSNLSDAFGAIADAVRAAPTQANVVVYVVSDFQRKDWRAEGAEEGDRGAVAPLVALADEDRPVRLVLVDVAVDASPRNVALVDLRRTQAKSVATVPTRFEAAVANYTDRKIDELEMSIRAGRHTLAPVTIRDLGPGQVAREPFEVAFPAEGSQYVEVQLVGASRFGDGILADNQRIEPVDVAAALRVLMVNGERSGDPYNDEVFLLRTALRPEGRAASGNEIDVIDEQDLEGVDLADYDVVILANVGGITASAARRLETCAEAGGGVIVFAGDQVEAARYNALLYREGRGLLPLPLGDVTESPGGADVGIARWDAAHPVMRAFADELAAVLKKARFTAFVKTGERVPTTMAATAPGAGDADDAAPAARVLARLSDADETPLMVERAFGRGRCIFVGTSADQEWNDWATSFSYLPMMMELVQYAARPSAASAVAAVGSVLECAVDESSVRPSARLRTPQYPVEAEAPIAAVLEAGEAKFRYADTQRSGLYRFELSDAGDRPLTRFGAVYCPPAESNLTRATRTELESVCAGLGMKYVSDLAALSRDSSAARVEIWWPLLMAAIVMFMSEHVLAWWFGTRG